MNHTRLLDLTSSACPPSHPHFTPNTLTFWPFPAHAEAVSSFCTFAPSVPFGWNVLPILCQESASCLQAQSSIIPGKSLPGHVQLGKDSSPGSGGKHVPSLEPSVSRSSSPDLAAQIMLAFSTSPGREWKWLFSLSLQHFGGRFPGVEGCGLLG